MILTLDEIDLLITTAKEKANSALIAIWSNEYNENYETQKKLMLYWLEIVNRLEELIEYKKKLEKEQKS